MTTDMGQSWPAVMPGSKLPHGVNFTHQLVRWIGRGQDVSLGAKGRSRLISGFEYECTEGGQTGQVEPRWPTRVDRTVRDGSVEWTCRAVTTNSLLTTLASVAWVGPTGLTITGSAVFGQVSTAVIEVASDVAHGEDLPVDLVATLADGNLLPVRVFLPVRLPVECDF
jgi:hypothetical protein